MCPKCFNARIFFCQLGLGKQSVNLFVTCTVHQDCYNTPLRFWYQMVGITQRLWNFSITQSAYREFRNNGLFLFYKSC